MPAIRGGSLAILAAILFGISTPLVQRAGAGLGAFTTAALLYTGAGAIGAALFRDASEEAALRRRDFLSVALMALFGAGVGPVALAWGLQRTSGASASMILALEAPVTALLAYIVYRETMNRRVWAAMLLLLAGGLTVIRDRAAMGVLEALGMVAVLFATAAWGIDNTLSRAVAERDPGQVVLAKAILGVIITGGAAAIAHEPLPKLGATCELIAIGATGYGLSLRLYLLAQRAFGATRTGSVFAFAPFIGALGAIALGDRSLDVGVASGGAMMLAGVALHLGESHGHEHSHFELEHEHAHTHNDGHHMHTHHPMPARAHSHLHRHDRMCHAHPHVPDVHHQHEH